MKDTQRIDVADALRGFAVMGIVLIHCLENYNLFNFTPIDNDWMKFADTAINSSVFFIFGGKAYGMFALLFGFSFFIQDNNQLKRGNDFRLRFLWRLVLLFIWGMLNSLIYTGDVLSQYALIGISLILVCRFSTKTVLIIATILVLQPTEWFKVFSALFNPDYVPAQSMVGYHYDPLTKVLLNGNFMESLKVMVEHSQLGTSTWAFENGRFPQIAALFMFGMVIGRKGFFLLNDENTKKWIRGMVIAVICFFPLMGLVGMLPNYITNSYILTPLQVIIKSYANVAFMTFLILLILLIFYKTVKGHKALALLIPYGKMSLTNYLVQSVIGGFIFYSWGLGLSTSITISFLIGIAIFLVQCSFSHWWMKRYRHGPLEYIWKKATWIGTKKQ
ncbi:DUF418 domain-containing protein [Dysgonomonas sp. ZJ709]|uniref:DUF418 domain-containing protein n=1 Tax=Dysgonomonas sp. ZJ709 TaxID=2709797 RepID=UPI0013EB44C4|nr:DUF418 domain-containing protein [Dysgonomonas sp. ZJ709]